MARSPRHRTLAALACASVVLLSGCAGTPRDQAGYPDARLLLDRVQPRWIPVRAVDGMLADRHAIALPALPAESLALALLEDEAAASHAHPITIAYSFSTADRRGDQVVRSGSELEAFSDDDKALTRAVLATIEAVCNVRFVESASPATVAHRVRYAYSQRPRTLARAAVFQPGTTSLDGDVLVSPEARKTQVPSFLGATILHETLHALGLKHPFEGRATLPEADDLIVNSVMSYSPMAGSQIGVLSTYPREPMALDIRALQALYGPPARPAGNAVYDLASDAFQHGLHTVWNAGGTDTFDASGLRHGAVLDLRPGGRSHIGGEVQASALYPAAGKLATHTARYTGTLTIAYGTTIARARGSDHGDLFIAGPGTERIDAGAGEDVVAFDGNAADYAVTEQAGRVVVTRLATGHVTTLTGVEWIAFADAMRAVAPPPDARLVARATTLSR